MHCELFKPTQEMTFATVLSDHVRLIKCVKEMKGSSITLDLSAVTQCDSAGLALLIEAKRLCAKKNKTCNIEGMPQIIESLAEFCGVDSILINS